MINLNTALSSASQAPRLLCSLAAVKHVDVGPAWLSAARCCFTWCAFCSPPRPGTTRGSRSLVSAVFVQAELLIHKHTVASRLLHYRNRFLSLILISLTVPTTLRGCFKLGSTGSPLETPYSSQQLRGLHCLERKKLGDKDIGMLGPYLQSAKWEEKKNPDINGILPYPSQQAGR